MSNKSKFIARFTLSYVMILLPVFLLSLLVSQITIRALAQKEKASVNAQLEAVVEKLDSLYNSYFDRGILIANKTQLSAQNMLSSYVNAQTGIRIMQDVGMLDSTIMDFFLYYHTGEIYSLKGYTHADTYFAQLLDCNESSTDIGLIKIESAQYSAAFLKGQNTGGCLLLHYPIFFRRSFTETSINFCISYDKLTEMFPRFSDTEKILFRLASDESEACFLYEKGKYQLISPRQYQELTNHTGLVSLSHTASLSDIQVDLQYPRQTFLADVRNNQRWNLIIIALGLFISMMLSLWQSKNRVKRIDQLETVAKGNEDVSGKRSDEYDYLRSLIQNNLKETADSRIRSREYLEILKQQITQMLLYGLFSRREDFNKIASACGINLLEEHFCVISISIQSPSILQAFEKYIKSDLYIVRNFQGISIVILFAELPNPDFTKRNRLELAEHICAILKDFGVEQVHAKISRTYQDLEMARYAYQEVLELTEESFQHPDQQEDICCWDISSENLQLVLNYEKDSLELLKDALAKRNEEESIQLLMMMNRRISISECLNEHKRYLRYEILHAIIAEAQKTFCNVTDAPIGEIIKLDPAKEKDFVVGAKKAIQRLCSYTVNSDEFIQEAVRFIEANYADSNLSAELVAQHIGMNKTYLSRLFKSKTGMSYIDFLTHFRMEKACKLFRETELPMKEIVQMVGYIDDSSFRKKFKAIYGIRVSDYRKKCQSTEKTHEGGLLHADERND